MIKLKDLLKLKEAVETYKSILIAEGFLDVLVDLVFGRLLMPLIGY